MLSDIRETEAAAQYQRARIVSMANAIGRISHDLRGILSPALLAAERLHASPEPTVRRASDVVARAVDRAIELIQATLELARDEPSAPRIRARLRDLIDDDTVLVEGADIWIAEIYPPQLAEAFAALFRDARYRGAATIKIGADLDLAILIIDDGAAPVPEPFRPMPGMGAAGYALAIARELIRAQGGQIGLEAANPGATTFRIVLPSTRLA